MEVWEIIEFVRKQKGISVAELCGKEVSRSVYERFVKNQADTTVSKFSYFLQKLNLGYDELRIFDYPPEVANMDRMMKETFDQPVRRKRRHHSKGETSS